MSIMGWRGEQKKTMGSILREAARCRTLQEGPHVYRGLALSPGKPRVPHCEERPGAAHFRRDQMSIMGWRGEQKKTAGSILREAARSRTLQEGPNVPGVGGEPEKTAGPIL